MPFMAAGIAKVFGGPVIDLYALSWGTAYAGGIITFIGAVQWGVALDHKKEKTRNILFIWSVLPALAVWPVMTLPPILRLPFFIIGLVILWAADMIFYKLGHLPRWYIKLRHGLTAVATVSLTALAFG